MKEYHWFKDYYTMMDYRDRSIGYDQTKRDMDSGKTIIYTDQSHFITTDLLDEGWRIYLHFEYESCVEIKYGYNAKSGREIRKGLNLEKLLYAGEFGDI